MLSKAFRLTSKEVSRIFKEGEAFDTDLFCFKYIHGEKVGYAVAISSKLKYWPVLKNRAKRLVFNVLKETQGGERPHIAGVFILKKDIRQLPVAQIQNEIIFIITHVNEKTGALDN